MKRNSPQKQQKKSRKILYGILGIIAGLVLVTVGFLTVISSGNKKAMNQCIDGVMTQLEEYYTVTPVDAGDYEELKLYGVLNFDVEQYQVEELGNLSIMRVNMGFMQMATVVITPREKNVPLLSADYMYILGNRKAYLEFYDLVAEKNQQYQKMMASLSEIKEKWEHLENITPSQAWYDHLLTVTTYKSGDTKADAELQKMLVENVKVYLEESLNFPILTEAESQEKTAITQEYTDGLIEKGGISTDVFKDALGEEETKKFFDLVFFGTLAQESLKN